jgi:hypothetical protein
LLVASLFALACNQQPSTSPSELSSARPSDPQFLVPAETSTRALDSAADDLEAADPEDQGLCSRSGGFWCQNQDGQHPLLPSEVWDVYLSGAVALLVAEGVVTSETEVAAAVCDVRRQLFRQLASLALNLSAGFVDPMATLTGEDAALGTVEDAFKKGAEIYMLGDAVSFEQRQSIKDTMDRINNNQSLANECTPDPGPLPEDDTPGVCSANGGGLITICHIPPGNPAMRITITIGAPAWPAHQAHGDTCGPC